MGNKYKAYIIIGGVAVLGTLGAYYAFPAFTKNYASKMPKSLNLVAKRPTGHSDIPSQKNPGGTEKLDNLLKEANKGKGYIEGAEAFRNRRTAAVAAYNTEKTRLDGLVGEEQTKYDRYHYGGAVLGGVLAGGAAAGGAYAAGLFKKQPQGPTPAQMQQRQQAEMARKQQQQAAAAAPKKPVQPKKKGPKYGLLFWGIMISLVLLGIGAAVVTYFLFFAESDSEEEEEGIDLEADEAQEDEGAQE